MAAGGIIRIVNGCTVEDGRVTEVRLPAGCLARFQVAEYLRAFLAGRVAHVGDERTADHVRRLRDLPARR